MKRFSLSRSSSLMGAGLPSSLPMARMRGYRCLSAISLQTAAPIYRVSIGTYFGGRPKDVSLDPDFIKLHQDCHGRVTFHMVGGKRKHAPPPWPPPWPPSYKKLENGDSSDAVSSANTRMISLWPVQLFQSNAANGGSRRCVRGLDMRTILAAGALTFFAGRAALSAEELVAEHSAVRV